MAIQSRARGSARATRNAGLIVAICALAGPPAVTLAKVAVTQECLDSFSSSGDGGSLGELDEADVERKVQKAHSYSVKDHLAGFTGLPEEELMTRLQRKGRFHFEGEHAFWGPRSSTELRWFYSHSVDYLFGNAVHPTNPAVVTWTEKFQSLSRDLGPVLDYSGGVGNNVLYLASQGVQCEYFGIGWLEAAFAEYRVHRMQLEDQVTFRKPHASWTNWTLDPVNALPPGPRYSVVLAIDVLEHIPHYERTVQALVNRLQPGGYFFENSPFADDGGGDGDVRVHVGQGGWSMERAMGPGMTREYNGVWRKLSLSDSP